MGGLAVKYFLRVQWLQKEESKGISMSPCLCDVVLPAERAGSDGSG